MRKFMPWVGSRYHEGLFGTKVLILGESQYGSRDETLQFTSYIIEKYGKNKRSRFFTVTQRLVTLDKKRGYIPAAQRRAFWEKVAFYNYVQEFVGTKARMRPTRAHWLAAQQPFLETVEELKPDVIVVLGKETKRNLPKPLPSGRYAYVSHPSGRGFSYKKWQPEVEKAFAAAGANVEL